MPFLSNNQTFSFTLIMDLSSMIRVYGGTPYKPIQNLFTSTHKCHHKTRIKILESVFWSSDGQQMAQ